MEPAELRNSAAPQTDSPESAATSNTFFEDDPGSPALNIPTFDLQRQSSPSELSGVENDSGDVAGNKFKESKRGPDTAGNPTAYADPKVCSTPWIRRELLTIVLKWPFENIMIRERVSIRGVLRPLEPKSEIPPLSLPLHRLGKINESVARRYLIGQDLWAKKFSKTAKKIELKRRKNLELARSETLRTVKNIVSYLMFRVLFG
jgi:hypothetical protein